MLGNDADAEDVAQDALLQVVRRLDTFRGESDLTTWLHRVTVNAALLYRRKAAHRRERPADAPLDRLMQSRTSSGLARPSCEEPDRRALDREVRQLIAEAAAGLAPRYRSVYHLADVRGLSNAEVGARLGLGLAAVKSRLHRARRLMRAALAPYFQEACA
jgi:RNA polymerase sigma-70 factor (ECF subfamily)